MAGTRRSSTLARSLARTPVPGAPVAASGTAVRGTSSPLAVPSALHRASLRPAGGGVGDATRTAPAAQPAPSERRMADAVRALAIDATEAAHSGHPGLPLGMADAATVLWTRFLRFDAADPRWPDRDRFVLSAGHGSMLLYALLHLTGHAGMDADALRGFRRLSSPAAGHPEHGEHPGVEATTGPLGQGLATAVGLALAERMMAARFGKSLVDHRTWVVASDGDLMEGISHEAADLAGHLRLDRLTVLWDDNRASTDGDTSLARSSDQLRRFAALGWAAKRVDGHDPAGLAAALSLAVRSRKPTLIACRTAARSAAARADETDEDADGAGSSGAPWGGLDGVSGGAFGAVLGGAPWRAGEAEAAKRALGWPHPPFDVPPELAERWDAAGARGASTRRSWLKRLARHPLRAEFERTTAGKPPEAWHEAIAAVKAELAENRPGLATRRASQRALEALAPAVPELVGGSADLTDSNLTKARTMACVAPGSYGGRYVHYGVREHAMAACMNGLALHGGLLPYGGTYLAFSDYMRPALRLAAIMRQRVIYVLTHDSIGLGADGPTHQPVEHLAGLRALPGLHVMRPADAVETAECWELAIRRTDGPSALVLSRQALPALRADAAENRSARGGYVLAEADGARQATLVATGSEVSLVMQARELLAADGVPVAVVSLPCWELFAGQDEGHRAGVLGSAPRFGVEAACDFGWERWLGADGVFIGMPGFGASAPAEDLYRHFGLTPEAVVAAVKKRLGQQGSC